MACAAYLRYVLEREGDVAAVVAEPARATATFAPPGYWQAVRRACDEHGALLIFDEIPTGLGKTGAMFAAEHEGVVPDIVVLGKALGGGMLPVAAVLCRAELDVGGDWAFGHYTHEKNPLIARAALTTIEIIEDEGLVENARRIGALALARLQDMARTRPLIGEVRGRGLLLGVDLVADPETRIPAAEAAERVMYAALANGLSFKTSMGNVLVLSPPLTITAAEMHAALDILQTAIDAAARGG
jgi:4-aminobutyrate aminotransferase